jgi:acyl-CoA thioester hydrolase
MMRLEVMMRLKNLPLSSFPFQTQEHVRYRDTDRQGHVNNTVFGTYFETGRVRLLYEPNQTLLEGHSTFVVVKITMELLGEIHWPDTVDIGVGILRINANSLIIGSNLYVSGHIVASSEVTVMHVNAQEKKVEPLPKNLFKKFTSYLLLLP